MCSRILSSSSKLAAWTPTWTRTLSLCFLFHLGQLQGLLDGVAHRLFEIDVLAGLDGVDGHACVPVIGSGDQNGIDLGIAENVLVLLDRDGRSTNELAAFSARLRYTSQV